MHRRPTVLSVTARACTCEDERRSHADTRRGVVGFVANARVVVGALAVGAVVIGALVAGAAVLALIAAVCLFPIPLALLGGSVGNGSKGTYPRRHF